MTPFMKAFNAKFKKMRCQLAGFVILFFSPTKCQHGIKSYFDHQEIVLQYNPEFRIQVRNLAKLK